MLENIFSVCTLKDIETWQAASPRITRYIKSLSYTLIVPKHECEAFKRCTPGEFKVVPEDEYIDPAFAQLLRARVAASRKGLGRYGWYLQQFIKLSALAKTSGDDTSLIWDADTIPLKELTFKKHGKVLFYKSEEYHTQYFHVINTLLGLDRAGDFSFIAQCIPCKGNWFQEFITLIESNTSKNWEEGILDHINFGDSSGFSEYETLGTFIQSKYPEQISILNNRWCRRGNGLIGSVHNLGLFENALNKRYDFICFEGWDEAYSRFSLVHKTRKLIQRLKETRGA
tara:strand:+ start:593 stop:1447 length:855 start_codon:yes stop_codon:yes gene_type:complete